MKRLLTSADFLAAFQGVWSVGKDRDPLDSSRRFGNSQAVHDQAADGVILKTHPIDLHGYGVVHPAVPKKTKLASEVPIATTRRWGETPVPLDLPDGQGTDQYGILAACDGGFYQSFKCFYAVNNVDHASQCYTRNGETTPCYRLNGPTVASLPDAYAHNRVAGYMCRPPADMNASYLVGLCGTPGSAASSHGPSLYAVNFWQHAERGSTQLARPLLSYGTGEMSLPDWDNITTIRGAAWIETPDTHAVIFAGVRSIGATWYDIKGHTTTPEGFSEHTLTLPDGTQKKVHDQWKKAKGYHAEDYDQGLWIYNPDDLRAVLNGTMQPHEPRPAEWVSLRQAGLLMDGSNHAKWITASYRDGRLLIGQQHGFMASASVEPRPLFLEFRL